MNVTTIVLIPGLWMTALCWEHWVKSYAEKGYRVVARSWPGMEGSVEDLRRDQSSFASVGLPELVDHYEQIIRELDTPPVIVGYGLGALVTQVLLDRGWGAAGVAVAPAPMKGLLRNLIPTLRAFLSDVLTGKKANLITRCQFRRAFTNDLTESESKTAFERYVVPGPNRMLLQTALAMFTPQSATLINFRNDTRAPLLFVAGGKDRVAPPSLVKANFDLYRESKAESDYKEYPKQAHLSLLQDGKIADYVLGWALCRVNGTRLGAVSGQTGSWSVKLSA